MKKALLIGINEYPSLDTLQGAVNDTLLWKDILIRYGFQSEDIIVLNEPWNTYSGDILNQMRLLTSSLKANDIGVIVFSGHGGQKILSDGTTKECLFPYNDDRAIYDDEIETIIDYKHPDAQLVFIADCCHAGGIIGDIEKYIAMLKASNLSDTEINTILQNKFQTMNMHEAGLMDIDITNMPTDSIINMLKTNTVHNITKVENHQNQLLLASSGKDQRSKEIKIEKDSESTYYGAFSYYAHKILKDADVNTYNYTSFIEAVQERLQENSYTQTAQLLPTASALKEDTLFSITSDKPQKADIADTTDDKKTPMCYGEISEDGKTVTVQYTPSFKNKYYKEEEKLLEVTSYEGKKMLAVIFRISARKPKPKCECPGEKKTVFKHRFENTHNLKKGHNIRIFYINENKSFDELRKEGILIDDYFKYIYKKIEHRTTNRRNFDEITEEWNTRNPLQKIKVCKCKNKEPRSGGNGGIAKLEMQS